MGRDSPPVFWSGIQIWCVWAILGEKFSYTPSQAILMIDIMLMLYVCARETQLLNACTVRFRSHGPDHSLRNSGNRAQETSTQRAHLS
jgi:hypothetical protein